MSLWRNESASMMKQTGRSLLSHHILYHSERNTNLKCQSLITTANITLRSNLTSPVEETLKPTGISKRTSFLLKKWDLTLSRKVVSWVKLRNCPSSISKVCILLKVKDWSNRGHSDRTLVGRLARRLRTLSPRQDSQSGESGPMLGLHMQVLHQSLLCKERMCRNSASLQKDKRRIRISQEAQLPAAEVQMASKRPRSTLLAIWRRPMLFKYRGWPKTSGRSWPHISTRRRASAKSTTK